MIITSAKGCIGGFRRASGPLMGIQWSMRKISIWFEFKFEFSFEFDTEFGFGVPLVHFNWLGRTIVAEKWELLIG